ncbi:MAG: GntR family transcriptional regulator [Candidatus Melainabacteria bacterium]|jgi:GntR family transcriptional regulator|nr:GntR family transcriptional regulator [Candidatus Melainabacteria bacterium]MBX9673829.1 GntR family transcriptional regulator [Candidatus Obscuribacterales bacterium]
MKISISKDSSIPIRDQLIEQLGLQIAAGTLKPHQKLPSIRALADRLGVHYSTITAAYNHMADVGLLEVRQGSGVRVAASGPLKDATEVDLTLKQMCDSFLAQAAERGFSCEEVLLQAETLRQRKPVKRLLCIDANKDFHQVIKNELAPHFSLPVDSITPQEFKANPDLQKDSLLVTSLYHLYAFQDHVVDLTRLIACNIEPGRSDMEAVENLQKGALIVLVSVSPTMMHMAQNLIAALRGEEVAVRSIEPSDTTEIKYIVRHADLFITDKQGAAIVKDCGGEGKMRTFQLYSQSTIDKIKERLAKWG